MRRCMGRGIAVTCMCVRASWGMEGGGGCCNCVHTDFGDRMGDRRVGVGYQANSGTHMGHHQQGNAIRLDNEDESKEANHRYDRPVDY